MASPISPRTAVSDSRPDEVGSAVDASPVGYSSPGEEDEGDRADGIFIVARSAELMGSRTSLGRPTVAGLPRVVFQRTSITKAQSPSSRAPSSTKKTEESISRSPELVSTNSKSDQLMQRRDDITWNCMFQRGEVLPGISSSSIDAGVSMKKNIVESKKEELQGGSQTTAKLPAAQAMSDGDCCLRQFEFKPKEIEHPLISKSEQKLQSFMRGDYPMGLPPCGPSSGTQSEVKGQPAEQSDSRQETIVQKSVESRTNAHFLSSDSTNFKKRDAVVGIFSTSSPVASKTEETIQCSLESSSEQEIEDAKAPLLNTDTEESVSSEAVLICHPNRSGMAKLSEISFFQRRANNGISQEHEANKDTNQRMECPTGVNLFTGSGMRVVSVSQIMSNARVNSSEGQSPSNEIIEASISLFFGHSGLSSEPSCGSHHHQCGSHQCGKQNTTGGQKCPKKYDSTATSTRASSILVSNSTSPTTGPSMTRGLTLKSSHTDEMFARKHVIEQLTTIGRSESTSEAKLEGQQTKPPPIKLRSAQGMNIELEDWRPHGSQMLKRFVAKVRGSIDNPFKPQPIVPLNLSQAEFVKFKGRDSLKEAGELIKGSPGNKTEEKMRPIDDQSMAPVEDSVDQLKKYAAQFETLKIRRQIANGRDAYCWKLRPSETKRKRCQPAIYYVRTGSKVALGHTPLGQRVLGHTPLGQAVLGQPRDDIGDVIQEELSRTLIQDEFRDVIGGAKNFLASIQEAFKCFECSSPDQSNQSKGPYESTRSQYRRIILPSYQLPSLSHLRHIPNYTQLCFYDSNPTHIPGCPLFCPASTSTSPDDSTSSSPSQNFSKSFSQTFPGNRSPPGTGCLICQCLMAGQSSLSALARASLSATFSTTRGLNNSAVQYLRIPTTKVQTDKTALHVSDSTPGSSLSTRIATHSGGELMINKYQLISD